MPPYLFVLCPTYSGSTLLSKWRNPLQACQHFAAFMPELGDMDYAASFEVHSIDGTLNRPITDLNTNKIASLTSDTATAMKEIFVPHLETIEAWDYELLVPGENP